MTPLQSHVQSLRADPHPQPDYRVCRTPDDFLEYMAAKSALLDSGQTLILGADTESRPGGYPHCLTFSHTPGTGRLIYVRDKATLSVYAGFIHTYNPVQVFHNWLHDTVPMSTLSIPHSNFIDTMVWAYNLCLGGGGDDDEESRAGRGYLGLKPLSYRLLNMTMTSFKDTVYPHSGKVLARWLNDLLTSTAASPACVCGHSTSQHAILERVSKKTGKVTRVKVDCSVCSCLKHKAAKYTKTQDDKLYGLLNRKTGKLLEDILVEKADLDPWSRIGDWHDWDRERAVELVGAWPVPSVEHLPEDALIYYACRDADADLRLYYYLLALQNGMVDGGPWIWYN